MGDQCRGRLVIQDGGFEGMEYEVIEAETLVGRSPTTDITLLDESISREHALVLYDHETRTFSVEDLQSTNGTTFLPDCMRNRPSKAPGYGLAWNRVWRVVGAIFVAPTSGLIAA